jgi:hypothetical protein
MSHRWRTLRLYKYSTDKELRRYKVELSRLFRAYAVAVPRTQWRLQEGLDSAKAKQQQQQNDDNGAATVDTDADSNGRMLVPLHRWRELVADMKLNQFHLHQGELNLIFMSSIPEAHSCCGQPEFRSGLKYVDFLEALVRLSEAVCLPTHRQCVDAGVASVRDFHVKFGELMCGRQRNGNGGGDGAMRVVPDVSVRSVVARLQRTASAKARKRQQGQEQQQGDGNNDDEGNSDGDGNEDDDDDNGEEEGGDAAQKQELEKEEALYNMLDAITARHNQITVGAAGEARRSVSTAFT